ncbi:MAG TPA: VOC family protein [Gemmatimonadales bacterium]
MEISGIKHIAVAVHDLEQALALYQRLLGVGQVTIKESQAKTREAWVVVGGVEFQLIQPLPGEGRYSEFMATHNGEGVHHVCYTVDNIDEALAEVRARGAKLTPCRSCQVAGSHKHSEGWVAFLEDRAAGLEIEFMQVYKPGEGKDAPNPA